MNSILGKLICKEFGRKKYKYYHQTLKREETMKVFIDMCQGLYDKDELTIRHKVYRLLEAAKVFESMNRQFLVAMLGYLAAMILVGTFFPWNVVKIGTMIFCSIAFFYKVLEYFANHRCDGDRRLILIYKSVLMYLLSKQ